MTDSWPCGQELLKIIWLSSSVLDKQCSLCPGPNDKLNTKQTLLLNRLFIRAHKIKNKFRKTTSQSGCFTENDNKGKARYSLDIVMYPLSTSITAKNVDFLKLCTFKGKCC